MPSIGARRRRQRVFRSCWAIETNLGSVKFVLTERIVGPMTVAGVCGACDAELLAGARFCHACGSPADVGDALAEYKHVTVLFADVVHSMDIAAAVGAERLREIMSDLASRCADLVQRFGGTIGSFTGDGVMALFGAPTAIEDHAVHACMAALAIQDGTKPLAAEVWKRDGIELALRVGLNSGEVIVGKIGSGPFGYTAIGEHVGVAQRMESVAPPGGVMLSDSTARLVAHAATLAEPELVRIKGREELIPVRQLHSIDFRHGAASLRAPRLVGRQFEIAAITATLDAAMSGKGRVVEVVGPPGIGKTRIGEETAKLAARRGAKVHTTFAESYAGGVPFGAVRRLLRSVFGAEEYGASVTRQRLRVWLADAAEEDCVLLDDLLGIGEPEAGLPDIDPDARRRRLAALINSAFINQSEPAVYVIEDAHWIDEASESLLVQFLSVVAQTSSVVVITYRPEYRGALAGLAGSMTFTLSPLDDADATALATGLLGDHPSNRRITGLIVERTSGNPFFLEEIVRDLASRGVLVGSPGEYECVEEVSDIQVPSTLHSTIAARIDRLSPPAKQTLSAAAVLGSRFSAELLSELTDKVQLGELLDADLIGCLGPDADSDYVFRHPLVRMVAYESQLSSSRTQLHRRAAAAIEDRWPDDIGSNAALIAAHLGAAGELRPAFDWHMRAGEWLRNRDLGAARASWGRAQSIADRLDDDPDQIQMRIGPRTILCATAWRVGGSPAEAGISDLRELTSVVGDSRPLATATSGFLLTLAFNGRLREAAQLGVEHAELLESIGDPAMTVGLLFGSIAANWESGQATVAARLAQRVIDLAAGDPAMGNIVVGSPLALALSMRGMANSCLGLTGWKHDLGAAVEMARDADYFCHVLTTMFSVLPMGYGALLPDSMSAQQTAELVGLAMRSGDDFTLANARMAHGALLVLQDGADRERGFELLGAVREAALQQRFTLAGMWFHDILKAQHLGRSGNLNAAINLVRTTTNDLIDAGCILWSGTAISTLVELLLQRAGPDDLNEAEASIAVLADSTINERFTLHELPLLRLRALLAQTLDLPTDYRINRDLYRRVAASCEFEGHMKWSEDMP